MRFCNDSDIIPEYITCEFSENLIENSEEEIETADNIMPEFINDCLLKEFNNHKSLYGENTPFDTRKIINTFKKYWKGGNVISDHCFRTNLIIEYLEKHNFIENGELKNL